LPSVARHSANGVSFGANRSFAFDVDFHRCALTEIITSLATERAAPLSAAEAAAEIVTLAAFGRLPLFAATTKPRIGFGEFWMQFLFGVTDFARRRRPPGNYVFIPRRTDGIAAVFPLRAAL
jgi:hypothetical protein